LTGVPRRTLARDALINRANTLPPQRTDSSSAAPLFDALSADYQLDDETVLPSAAAAAASDWINTVQTNPTTKSPYTHSSIHTCMINTTNCQSSLLNINTDYSIPLTKLSCGGFCSSCTFDYFTKHFLLSRNGSECFTFHTCDKYYTHV